MFSTDLELVNDERKQPVFVPDHAERNRLMIWVDLRLI